MNKIIFAVIALVLIVGGVYYFTNMSDKQGYVATTTPQGQQQQQPQQQKMSFFITSTNPGMGASLGGLAGADAYCSNLAVAAGVTGQTWRSYLSAAATGTTAVVNAKDRIGGGPWYNANGVLIANTLAELHGSNNLRKETALTERGAVVAGRGDTVNVHDILTGSNADGTLKVLATDTTCSNWTSGTTGSAWVGHHDRMGLDESAAMKSWNSSHASRGCSLPDLQGTGGGGLFYCFAQ